MSEAGAVVQIERVGAVAVVTLNRPEACNAMDVAWCHQLQKAAIECYGATDVRAVLLRSRGRFFCAGGDINAFYAAGDRKPQLVLEATGHLHSAIARLARMDKPLVVAVQGSAAGAGFGLAMLGDIVIASEQAQFNLAYTAIGLTPDAGASWLLPRLVGLRKAQELILLNDRLSASEALTEGLITRVVAADALEAEAMWVAESLASGPTRAFGRVRSLLLSAYGETLETHLELEAQAVAQAIGEPDGQEGVNAFIAKRKPSFTGGLR